MDCEREVDAMKKAEYMAQHVGEEFDGVVSSVVKFGLFIELPNTIEGLIHINALKQDYFHFMETQLVLVGERTGLTFKIGQKVRVKVVKADPVTNDIDFELVTAEEVTPVQRPQANRKRRRKNEKQQRQQNNGKKAEQSAKAKASNKSGNQNNRGAKKSNEARKKANKGRKNKKPFYKGIKKGHK